MKGLTPLLIFVACVLTFAGTLSSGFVLDDQTVVSGNAFVKDWRNLPRLAARSYLTRSSDIKRLNHADIGSGEGTYRPMVTLTYFFDYAVWKDNPFGFHLTNLLLHALTAVLLYRACLLLGAGQALAVMAALFFGIHPVNAEAVSVIAFREDLLVGFFCMLSLILFLKADALRGRTRLFLSALCFFCALLSKESAAAFILLLPAAGLLFGERGLRVRRFIPYAAAVGLFVLLRFVVFASPEPFPINSAMEVPRTVVYTMTRVFAGYAQWLIVPFGIHSTLPDDNRLISPVFSGQVALSAALLAALVLLVYRQRRNRLLLFGSLWCVIFLLPVSHIMPLTNYFAPRYLYVPCAGFCLCAAAMCGNAAHRQWLRTALIALAVPLAVMLAHVSNSLAAVFADDITFWRAMVREYPDDPVAYSSLGQAYADVRAYDSAIRMFTAAVGRGRPFAGDYAQMGYCYLQKGELQGARDTCGKAISIDLRCTDAYFYRGLAYGQAEMFAQAAKDFSACVALEPGYAMAYFNLGVTYARMGELDRARAAWDQAVGADPRNKELVHMIDVMRARLRLL